MNHENSYELGLKIALHRFTEEMNRREALDTKASLVLGFSSVLIGLLFNLFSSFAMARPVKQVEALILVLLAFALIAIFLAVISSLTALGIRQYRGGPGGKILIHVSETQPKHVLESKLIRAYAQAYQSNWEQNQRKSKYLFVGFVALTVGTSLAFLCFVAIIWI